VSAKSGISTFRDKLTGLWENFEAADLATPDAFRCQHTGVVLRQSVYRGLLL
jgi:NAD-dependent SIR2 family protein deacetylase